MAKEKNSVTEPPHIETAFDEKDVYAESDSPAELPKKHIELVVNGIKGGWIPYRGIEQHGVQQPQIPFPVDDWEADVTYEIDTRQYNRPRLRDAEPTGIVRGWADEQAVRTKANMLQVPLAQDTWVKVLEFNPRRTFFKWWVDPSPQGSNPLIMTTDENSKAIPALCPQLLGGGVSNSAPWEHRFTDELWLFSSGIARTFHVVEEYEVEF